MIGRKVSIIVPNYDGEKYIDEMIQSVIRQTYTNWELIIVDDGSTDKSKDIISKYLSDNIYYIRRPENRKKGANACRNIGVENAKGEYVVFLDSDDLLAEYCLEQRVKWMDAHITVDFAVFNMYRFYESIENKIWHTKLHAKEPLVHFLGLNCLWQTTSPIWRLNFVKQNKFNENYSRLQDPELVIRCLLQDTTNYALVKESIPDAYYRIILKRKNNAMGKPVIVNNNKPYTQLIHDYYPLKDKTACFDKSKSSLFLQLAWIHLLSHDSSNIVHFRKSVRRLEIKFNLMYKIIYYISTHQKILCLMKYGLSKRVVTSLYSFLQVRIWGDLYVKY